MIFCISICSRIGCVTNRYSLLSFRSVNLFYFSSKVSMNSLPVGCISFTLDTSPLINFHSLLLYTSLASQYFSSTFSSPENLPPHSWSIRLWEWPYFRYSSVSRLNKWFTIQSFSRWVSKDSEFNGSYKSWFWSKSLKKISSKSKRSGFFASFSILKTLSSSATR